MNESSVAQVRADTQSALLTIALRWAAELARAGKHGAALELLAALAAEDSSLPPALDLLARVHAQEARYQEAAALWTRAVELSPANDAYRQALRRVRRIMAGAIPRLLAIHWLAFGTSVIVVVGASTVAGTLILRGIAREGPGPAVVAQAAPPSPPAALPPAMSEHLAGFHQRIHSDGTILFVPDSGLFASGAASLTPRARALLSGLGERLQPYQDSIEIEIIGYTDDIPVVRGNRFKDNIALGMARAVAVHDYLRSTTTLLPAHMSVRSGGEGTLFPGGDSSARLRNRTVTLRIAARF